MEAATVIKKVLQNLCDLQVLLQHSALMATFVLLEVLYPMKAEWRFAIKIVGAPSVIMVGVVQMLQLFAGS